MKKIKFFVPALAFFLAIGGAFATSAFGQKDNALAQFASRKDKSTLDCSSTSCYSSGSTLCSSSYNYYFGSNCPTAETPTDIAYVNPTK